MHYKIWNKIDDIVTPVGRVYSAKVWMSMYPMYAKTNIDAVIVDQKVNGAVCLEYESFVSGYRGLIDFSDCVTKHDYITKINQYEDEHPPIPTTEPVSSQERIAAALEALVMLQMEDVPEGEIR